MFKKIYAGIYLLPLMIMTYNYAAEADSSIPNFTTGAGADNSKTQSHGKINVQRAEFPNATIHNHQFNETRYVPYKAYNDPHATFGQKIQNSFAEGAWESWSSVPHIITNIVVQTATTILFKKAMDWFNGASSESPTTQEIAAETFMRKDMTDVAMIQMKLKMNSEALQQLKANKKIFENYPDKLEKNEQQIQDLIKNHETLTDRLHAAANASAQAEYGKKQTVFSYPKAAQS